MGELSLQLYFSNELALMDFAGKLAQHAPKNATLYLEGELGAGKTTFARGFLKGINYQGFVKSPTYTIVEFYQLDQHKIYHFDLYRIADPEELSFMGIEEYFMQDAIRLIEWSNHGKGFLLSPDLTIEILFEPAGRNLIITAQSEIGKKWLQAIK